MGFDQNMVEGIRSFNRFYTRILGLMDQDILQSGYSLAEARILYELSTQANITANQLSGLLGIDKSYLSRILAGLTSAGLVTKRVSQQDSRAFLLELSEQGMRIARELAQQSNLQIKTLLAPLKQEERTEIVAAMSTVQRVLTHTNMRIRLRAFENTRREADFILEKQLELYAREYGFTSPEWKRYVTDGVEAMISRFTPDRDFVCLLEQNDALCGCIAIVYAGEGAAQLRFFFVDPSLRGFGVGELLIESALNFCRQKNYASVFLWTCSGLAAARHLYHKHGFVVTESHENSEWGTKVTEERWELMLEA